MGGVPRLMCCGECHVGDGSVTEIREVGKPVILEAVCVTQDNLLLLETHSMMRKWDAVEDYD